MVNLVQAEAAEPQFETANIEAILYDSGVIKRLGLEGPGKRSLRRKCSSAGGHGSSVKVVRISKAMACGFTIVSWLYKVIFI